MIQIDDKKKCCGCTACYSICPVQCIAMRPDEEGFLYPVVDASKCMQCGACEKVCPINSHRIFNIQPMAYAVQNKENETLYHSAAGGAYSAIAKVVINKGGIVYGAAYTKDFDVAHVGTERMEKIKIFRSSKYVQSRQEDNFHIIKKQLKSGKMVCFSGTPCQVAGLKTYLGKVYKNLITVDLVCKGVASPEVLRQYVQLMEKQHNSKIVGMNFKRKTYGYHSSTMSVDFANGETYSKGGITDPMMRSFRANICLRPSCEECAFKEEARRSDLTLFDCWHYEYLSGKKDDDRGHTAVLVHTEKGREMFLECEKYLDIQTIDAKEVIEKDGIMVNNRVQFHPKRQEYMDILKKDGIMLAIDGTIPISLKEKLMDASKSILHKMGLLAVAKKIKGRQRIK